MDQEEVEGEFLHHWHGHSRLASMLGLLLETALQLICLWLL